MADDFQLFSSLRYDPALALVSSSGPNHAAWNRANASPLYMLDYHRDRMLRAATHWGWGAAIEVLKGDAGLERLATFIMSSIDDDQKAPLKVRISITREGQLGINAGPVPETPLANLFPEKLPCPGRVPSHEQTGNIPLKTPEYEVVVDDQGTSRSEHTHFKTTWRAAYDGARQRAQISLPDKKEVLLINGADGAVMEGSVTTVYLWRDGRWVTPAVSREYNPGKGSGGQDGTTRRWALEKGLAVEDTVLAGSLADGEECWLSNGARGFFFGRVKMSQCPVAAMD
ncbi:Aminodeoxychorismate lyase [Madurella mycetomatis]|uniref:Aminodeoxychorismate lyase n=1 Tax=Madurella mycetomatis TaxID=100816 RepID=A0A175W9U4_9PEZI|nr:Aminodeoxychorismate lyase [Madurella mycetomatis]KXX80578.1 Aminodeoxychorismate lyase [Madurella mycetomatis]